MYNASPKNKLRAIDKNSILFHSAIIYTRTLVYTLLVHETFYRVTIYKSNSPRRARAIHTPARGVRKRNARQPSKKLGNSARARFIARAHTPPAATSRLIRGNPKVKSRAIREATGAKSDSDCSATRNQSKQKFALARRGREGEKVCPK